MTCVLCAAGCGSTHTVHVSDARLQALPAPDPYETEQHLSAEATGAMAAGEYDAALVILREILTLNPTSTVAYVGMGEIYLHKRDYARAEPTFARAVELQPRNFDAQYGHGVALQMLERFVEAVKAYHRALTIQPDSIEANHHLATTYLQMIKLPSALIFAQKVVELDPANGPARANLGAVYEQLKQYDEAVNQYQAAIELMEPTPPLLMNLINVLAKQHRYVDAKNTAEYLVRLVPSTRGYERLGWCHFRLRDYEASIQAYRQAVAIDDNYWPALNGVGCNALNTWLLSQKQDRAAAREARDAFRRSLRINPNQKKVIALLARHGP